MEFPEPTTPDGFALPLKDFFGDKEAPEGHAVPVPFRFQK
jgi:hypothetical protein